MRPTRFLVIGEQNGGHGFREMLRRGLLREGFSVECAENQNEALDMAAKNAPPDVVFLDNSLPGLDALQFKDQLHEVAPNARLLLINSGTD